jgi:hypothetical protein
VLSADELIDSDVFAEDIDDHYAAEVASERELAEIGRLIERFVKETYPFARRDRRVALEEEAWRVQDRGGWILDGDGEENYFSDFARAGIEKAMRETWRRLSRPSEFVLKASTRRKSGVRRPVCARPRERRDGSRSRSCAARGDPDDPDPAGGESPGRGPTHHIDHLRSDGPA